MFPSTSLQRKIDFTWFFVKQNSQPTVCRPVRKVRCQEGSRCVGTLQIRGQSGRRDVSSLRQASNDVAHKSVHRQRGSTNNQQQIWCGRYNVQRRMHVSRGLQPSILSKKITQKKQRAVFNVPSRGYKKRTKTATYNTHVGLTTSLDTSLIHNTTLFLLHEYRKTGFSKRLRNERRGEPTGPSSWRGCVKKCNGRHNCCERGHSSQPLVDSTGTNSLIF